MARLSSRELVLERRKVLATTGKRAIVAGGLNINRIRTTADIRPTRTRVAAATPRGPAYAPTDSMSPGSLHVQLTSNEHHHFYHTSPQCHPSRALVLARREALSRRGKSADTSRDRNRADVIRHSSSSQTAAAAERTYSHGATSEATTVAVNVPFALSTRSSERWPTAPKRHHIIENPSRALVLARREGMSKYGKSASRQPTSAASVARQTNPDLTSRELAQRVRELRNKSGATDRQRSGSNRPTGPNRHGARQQVVAVDAYWKVGVSETLSGQVVTGTQANRSVKTTGNEASTCRSITGTEYLGAEVFQTFCQAAPSTSQPAKVRLTSTSHGNLVTGNEVGRSNKVTGNEPGTCKNVTGTEYISAEQNISWCGESNPSPQKVDHSLTEQGLPVSGVMVGRSTRVTGNEAGYARQLTGNQYLGSDPLPQGRSVVKVGQSSTLSGSGITGTLVGRSAKVTGNEFGSCHRVTGDQYVSTEQVQVFCGGQPDAEAAKVGFSITNRNQVVSGTRTGRSSLVTGDEPGTCKTVTGTPYAGLEQAGQWCSSRASRAIQERTPLNLGTPAASMTGLQPGIDGVMTGSERGACNTITGTPYIGADQLVKVCGSAAPPGTGNYDKQTNDSVAWNQFSVISPARAAQQQRSSHSGVTGTRYEQGARITGPFDMAGGKVTGTEQFRFNYPIAQKLQTAVSGESEELAQNPASRITGEGISARITGDDWDRGEHVTGTEGISARRRNPSRLGTNSVISPPKQRNEEMTWPVSKVTGSSGNTDKGCLVTVSGGARG